MLALFPGIKINLVSPPNLAMPAEVVAEVKAKGTCLRASFLCS
jgi:aspartate carbamoyltransferase catalytic subunit